MIHTKKDTTVNVPKPQLDLRKVDVDEAKEAITGFITKHSQTHDYVIIIDVDGTARTVFTRQNADNVLNYFRDTATVAEDGAYVMVTDPSDVYKTFLELVQFTCPHGYELQMYDETLQDLGFVRNERGNYWLTVGDGTSKTLFVAHLDTADYGRPKVVKTELTPDNYVKTDGTTILGADDKAGMAVLLYMIANNVPGHYLMVIGEEVGCIGSGDEAKHIPKGKYDKAIQFDRMGVSEIITHQLGRRTASRPFARELAKQLRKASKGTINLEPSDKGMYTDTKEFTGVIKECTNIAIGYYKQHSVNEVQDASYLVTLAAACLKVDWEGLPAEQPYSVPTTYVSGLSRYSAAGTPWDDMDDIDDDSIDDKEYHTKYAAALEIGKKDIWTMWGEVSVGDMTLEQLRTWIVYNPMKASKIIYELINNNSTMALDLITMVEDNV